MYDKPQLTFSGSNRDFVINLNKRVNEYFNKKGTDRKGNSEMFIKTGFMFILYLLPYFLIITETVTAIWGLLSLVVVMGLGLAGIGLSVMHDANHGAYSKNETIIKVIGYSLNFLGASSFNWKLQHNVLHHSYTNVHEADEDISPRGVLRLSPHSNWKRMHKYQFIYAWPLYGLLTIVWVVFKDFTRMANYQKNGMIHVINGNAKWEWLVLILTKVVFFGYTFLIPLLVTQLNWWQILLGILIMHYLAGFILAIIFQPAHVIEGTEYPLPDENKQLKNNWAIHQLLTTTNFGNSSRWFSWFIGGLNFQIEHHLFPNICHVHYRDLAPIVKTTAEEYGLPYHTFPTFISALAGHTRLLKTLGKKPYSLPQ